MEVQLTPDQKAFVRQAIESGRLEREEDAVKEALSLWEEHERRRLEILVAVDKAEASLARSEGRRVTTDTEVAKLAADVKRRGIARLQRRTKSTRMSEFRLAPEAEAELDEIYIARQSGSIDVATRVVERITDRFWLLARYPYLGRARDHDLRPGLRSFPVDDYLIIHRIAKDGVVLILHVVHGSRDIDTLLGH